MRNGVRVNGRICKNFVVASVWRQYDSLYTVSVTKENKIKRGVIVTKSHHSILVWHIINGYKRASTDKSGITISSQKDSARD